MPGILWVQHVFIMKGKIIISTTHAEMYSNNNRPVMKRCSRAFTKITIVKVVQVQCSCAAVATTCVL